MDLGCAIADGAQVISDFRVMADQHELFGLAIGALGSLAILGLALGLRAAHSWILT